jgi:hypothetical protein
VRVGPRTGAHGIGQTCGDGRVPVAQQVGPYPEAGPQTSAASARLDATAVLARIISSAGIVSCT